MANKLKYFIGNWKMFGNHRSIGILYRINNFLIKNQYNQTNKKVVFCVPNTLISNFSTKFKNKLISIGAQNCHENEKFGPFTGSVSSLMLKKSGASYVILGHSENRKEGETNKKIKSKIKSALNQKLKVIFCVGESLKDKNQSTTLKTLKKQMKGSLSKGFDYKKILIAYEPVWSIGTGKIPKLEEVKKNAKYLKNEFKNIYKKKFLPKVLYGGSVNRNNINSFSKIKEIDGFLIGGASQSSKKFIDIIKNYYK